MRGDVYRLKPPPNPRGHEQRGERFCVVVQSDALPLSTWIVAPTSTSARPVDYRPAIEVKGQPTLVMVDQARAIDPQRLGAQVGRLSAIAMQQVDVALRIVLDLR